jgi:putative endonuclease
MKRLGKTAEDLAAAYLAANGFTVLARNWRSSLGEIDIVARDGDTLVFIEVKARLSVRCGRPEEAVTRSKQERLRTLAISYINATGHSAPTYRFDVLALNLRENEVSLIKDAF